MGPGTREISGRIESVTSDTPYWVYWAILGYPNAIGTAKSKVAFQTMPSVLWAIPMIQAPGFLIALLQYGHFKRL